MVECGGLENRFAGYPGNEGSNPSSSARKFRPPAMSRGLFTLQRFKEVYAKAGWDMNKQRVLRTFLDMVAIDSPSRSELGMARYCVRSLESMGFQIEYDDSQTKTGSDTPQIIARRKGAGSGRIALSAHMDCVVPCCNVHPHIENEAVYSDGTTILGADDKAGVAEIFEAIKSADEAGRPLPSIDVLLSVCEEQSVLGARCFPDDVLPKGTLCLVLDVAGPAGAIYTATPFHYVFTASFHGRAAHAGAEPQLGASAIQMAARAIDLMALGRLDDSTTASVGTIEGGVAKNIVPDSCTIVGECRSLSEKRIEHVRQNMDDALRQGARDFDGTVDVEWELSYPGIFTEEDDPDVQMLIKAAKKADLNPILGMTGGGSDANVLKAKGVKPIPLGCGMKDFHALNESVKLADLEGCALFIEEVLYLMGVRV